MILAEIAAGGNPDGSGVVEARPAGRADGGSTAVVLVVGGGVAEALVQAHGVVERLLPVEFEFELAGV